MANKSAAKVHIETYDEILDEANPHDIFMCEQALAGNNKVFIISTFPEFLVDILE